MTKNKDPMLQELGMALTPCPICLQAKPCPCEAAAMSIGRPDVIPCLKAIAQKAYDAGHWDSTIDTIEETIVELERLRATVVSLQDENSHLRAMNRRQIEALVEQMPPGMRMHEGKFFYERFMSAVGDGGQNPVVTPTKPPASETPN